MCSDMSIPTKKSVTEQPARTKTDKRFRSLLIKAQKEPPQIIDRLTEAYASWHCISLAEAAVMDIELNLFNSLMLSYERFMSMCDIVHVEFTAADGENDRQHYSQYLPDGWAIDGVNFCAIKTQKFMHEICEMPHHQCRGYIMFREAQDRRSGLIDYR